MDQSEYPYILYELQIWTWVEIRPCTKNNKLMLKIASDSLGGNSTLRILDLSETQDWE